MKEITAYKTIGNKIFEDEQKALEHEENLLGEALDDLFPNDDRGNVTRADRYNILTKMMDDPQLKHRVKQLNEILGNT